MREECFENAANVDSRSDCCPRATRTRTASAVRGCRVVLVRVRQGYRITANRRGSLVRWSSMMNACSGAGNAALLIAQKRARYRLSNNSSPATRTTVQTRAAVEIANSTAEERTGGAGLAAAMMPGCRLPGSPITLITFE